MADAMASGVESTWPRQKILSASSMTQIDVSFSDTSRPTYCLLWDMVSLLWRCGEASLYRQWLPRDYAMSRPALVRRQRAQTGSRVAVAPARQRARCYGGHPLTRSSTLPGLT